MVGIGRCVVKGGGVITAVSGVGEAGDGGVAAAGDQAVCEAHGAVEGVGVGCVGGGGGDDGAAPGFGDEGEIVIGGAGNAEGGFLLECAVADADGVVAIAHIGALNLCLKDTILCSEGG